MILLFGFSIQEFFICLFNCQKMAIVCKFSAYLLAENDFFSNVLHLLWVWDFEDMYLTHLESRIWISSYHIYFKKWFFWPSKLYCPPKVQGKKTFLSTLNVMILQIVKNEWVKFGGHVIIEVSYKILQLHVLKRIHVCKIHLALNRGSFETVLMKNTLRIL